MVLKMTAVQCLQGCLCTVFRERLVHMSSDISCTGSSQHHWVQPTYYYSGTEGDHPLNGIGSAHNQAAIVDTQKKDTSITRTVDCGPNAI